jgi:hypothetical protein
MLYVHSLLESRISCSRFPLFQLFYKIIPAIYSRALKLVRRTADLESILADCRLALYSLHNNYDDNEGLR